MGPVQCSTGRVWGPFSAVLAWTGPIPVQAILHPSMLGYTPAQPHLDSVSVLLVGWSGTRSCRDEALPPWEERPDTASTRHCVPRLVRSMINTSTRLWTRLCINPDNQPRVTLSKPYRRIKTSLVVDETSGYYQSPIDVNQAGQGQAKPGRASQARPDQPSTRPTQYQTNPDRTRPTQTRLIRQTRLTRLARLARLRLTESRRSRDEVNPGYTSIALYIELDTSYLGL